MDDTESFKKLITLDLNIFFPVTVKDVKAANSTAAGLYNKKKVCGDESIAGYITIDGYINAIYYMDTKTPAEADTHPAFKESLRKHFKWWKIDACSVPSHTLLLFEYFLPQELDDQFMNVMENDPLFIHNTHTWKYYVKYLKTRKEVLAKAKIRAEMERL